MLSAVNSLLMIVTIKTVFASIDNSIPDAVDSNSNNNNNKINEMIDTIRRVEEMHKIELTQSSNLQRQELLQQVCERLGSTNKTWTQLKADQMDHLLVDKGHKLLYCYVPKVRQQLFLPYIGLSSRRGWLTDFFLIIIVRI